MSKNKKMSNKEFAEVWAKVVAKAWHDEGFKKRLLSDPEGVLAEFGCSFEETIEVVETKETPLKVSLWLPTRPSKELEKEEPKKLAAGHGLYLWAKQQGY